MHLVEQFKSHQLNFLSKKELGITASLLHLERNFVSSPPNNVGKVIISFLISSNFHNMQGQLI